LNDNLDDIRKHQLVNYFHFSRQNLRPTK